MRKKVIDIILIILIGLIPIAGGILIGYTGKDIVSFCQSHYHNSTFLADFTGDEPYQLSICNYNKNNEDYRACIKYNATLEQEKFMNSCHWMGADYLIILFTVAPIIIGIGLIWMFLKEGLK